MSDEHGGACCAACAANQPLSCECENPMANQSDYMNIRPGVTSAASGAGCPAPLFSRELENCGYLRSPCKVWIAGNSESAVAAAVGTVSIDVQDPFLGDLVQMHTVDDATGAE